MSTRPSITRLTNQQRGELCRLGGIPDDHIDRFVQAVERCVATYQHLGHHKSAPAVGAELAQIENCIWRALRLLNRATWRPGEFHSSLADISARLRSLSPAARDYLQFRNLTIRHDVPSAWPDQTDQGVLVDPICFTDHNDQVLALRDLLGAFAAPVARKAGPGRPLKDLELSLYHFLAAAYSRTTSKAASDTSTQFMSLCFEIKRIYQLDDWNPESLARSARQPRHPG
jgi:hypothetical protein